MTLDELNNRIADKKVEEVKQPEVSSDIQDTRPLNPSNEIIYNLRTVKRHLTSAPTFTPKNYLEQFQLYDDGVDRRLYIYINGTWRFSALS